MHTPRMNFDGKLLRRLLDRDAFRSEPFVVIDVGASGGVDELWRRFGAQVKVFAFEPLTKEAARLQATAPAEFQYIAAFIGAGPQEFRVPESMKQNPFLGRSNYCWSRTSASRYREERPAYDYVTSEFNSNAAVEYTEERYSLDEWAQKNAVGNIDFIKVDTDGEDYAVLAGAKRVLNQGGVLGLFVECQFHGIHHPHANTFSNIDSFLRGEGFSLADLAEMRYTRATLPGKFCLPLSAQTRSGPLQFCDALFLRDAPLPSYEEIFKLELSPVKLIKLACLYELFGMPDGAAEILQVFRARLEPEFGPVEPLLDLLTPKLEGRSRTFREYNEAFSNNTELFFPRPKSAPTGVSRAASWVMRKVPGGRRAAAFLKRTFSPAEYGAE